MVARPPAVSREPHATHHLLSKPCDPDHLRRAVASAFALRDIIHNPTLVRLVSRIRPLPSLPSLYVKLQELVRAGVVDTAGRSKVSVLAHAEAGNQRP